MHGFRELRAPKDPRMTNAEIARVMTKSEPSFIVKIKEYHSVSCTAKPSNDHQLRPWSLGRCQYSLSIVKVRPAVCQPSTLVLLADCLVRIASILVAAILMMFTRCHRGTIMLVRR